VPVASQQRYGTLRYHGETPVSQPQTLTWLGRTRVALTSQTLVLLHYCIFQRKRLHLCFATDTISAHLNAFDKTARLQRLSHCSATVAVAQPLGLSPERFRKTQWPDGRRPLVIREKAVLELTSKDAHPLPLLIDPL
jgi:hypothetical protein